MADKRIQTELVVKAIDQYSAQIRNMSGVTGRFATKVRSEMGRLQGLRGPLRLIEDFRRQQTVVRSSASALDAANEKTRQLLATIRTTKNPTAAMRREFDRARTAAGRLEEKHHRNRAALRGLQAQMRSAGVNTADLAGEQRRLTKALGASGSAFGRQAERMQRLQAMQKKIGDSREHMRGALASAANTSFVGAASVQTGRRMIEGMSGPIKAAIEFESAMADVRKVVDFESPEAFKEMADDILKMSTKIPTATSELAMLVATGGQLGVAREDLMDFSVQAAKIGIAFDISAEKAANSLGTMQNSLDLTLAESGKLFDAMNHVSNNDAAKAEQTLDFLNRAGASGQTFGFDPTETLAFGSAMIAAGAGADTAATSFRNMGRALTKGESATKRQGAAFGQLGLDAADVAKQMQDDAVGTTQDVLNRLSALPKHLQASTMSDLFGDEARELTKLLNNMQLLPDMLEMVADESKYLGSAEEEYARRADTTANKLQLLTNQLTTLNVSIGEVILPTLNNLIEKSQAFLEKVTAWTKKHPALTKAIVISGVALGGMAVAGGVLLTAAGGLIGALAVLRFGLFGLGARAAFALGDLVGLGAGLRRLTAGRFRLRLQTPRFGRHLGGFRNFKTAAMGEMLDLERRHNRTLDRMARKRRAQRAALLSGVARGAIKGGAIGIGVGLGLGIKPVEDGTVTEKTANDPNLYKGSDNGMHQNDARFSAAVETLRGFKGRDLPTAAHLQALRDEAAAYRAEVEAAQVALDATPEFGSGITNPARVLAQADLAGAQAGLRQTEDKLRAAETAAVELQGALMVVDGTSVLPEIQTGSIDAALEKVARLSAQLRSLPGGSAGGDAKPVEVQKRARGGPFGTRPLLVGERGPELYFPNRAGFIANNQQMQRLQRGSQRVRAAALTGLAASAAAVAPVALAAAPQGGGGAASVARGSVTVQINGPINIPVPAGVTDPQAIAEIAADLLGQRVEATFAASFSD